MLQGLLIHPQISIAIPSWTSFMGLDDKLFIIKIERMSLLYALGRHHSSLHLKREANIPYQCQFYPIQQLKSPSLHKQSTARYNIKQHFELSQGIQYLSCLRSQIIIQCLETIKWILGYKNFQGHLFEGNLKITGSQNLFDLVLKNQQQQNNIKNIYCGVGCPKYQLNLKSLNKPICSNQAVGSLGNSELKRYKNNSIILMIVIRQIENYLKNRKSRGQMVLQKSKLLYQVKIIVQQHRKQAQMGLFDFILSQDYQSYLQTEQIFDSRVSPKTLIKGLSNKNTLNKLIKTLNKATKSSYKIIRRLHVCNLLLLYSDTFYQTFIQQVKIPLSQDMWLNEQFIKPYVNFMYKCSTQHERYIQCKRLSIQDQTIFDQLFFIINSLKMLFKTIGKISLIGKFYKSKSPNVFQGVIEMIAVQAKQLYFPFKNILVRILQDTQRYLLTPQHQQILKDILINDLSQINQEMKMLLLGKQFFPYGKSIGIKLFRIDEATQQLQSTMRGIVTSHCQTNRRMQREEIQDRLFNHKNGFNVKYFEETLSVTRSDSAPFIGMFGSNKTSSFKPQQQAVHSEDDDDQAIHSQDYQDPQQMSNSKKLTDTNQSNLNKEQNI